MSEIIERRIFTVDEYHQMAEAGILTEDDRVELINGEIIAMSPINSPYASVVDRISNFLKGEIGKSVIVRVQSPLLLSDLSEPEPDVMLLVPRDDFYASAHPQPKDVYLLIEVADSSVRIDQEIKLPVYAAAGVPEVWIVNLADRQVEVYRTPIDKQYQTKEVAKGDEVVAVPHFNLSVATHNLLGK